MKINIQNMDVRPVELDERVQLDFISNMIREYYPNVANVHVHIEKIKKNYRVHITLKTVAHYRCDRCLDEYDTEFSSEIEQHYHVGAGELIDEESIRISEDATEIDVDPVIAEMMLLNHPMKMLCKEDCKGLCPHCGVNLNYEACRCTDTPIDPRWEKLRGLIK